MVVCFINGCDNDSAALVPNISFHRIPHISVAYVFKLSGRTDLDLDKFLASGYKNRRVCSIHFNSSDFFPSNNRLRLRPTAVPSKNLPPELPIISKKLKLDSEVTSVPPTSSTSCSQLTQTKNDPAPSTNHPTTIGGEKCSDPVNVGSPVTTARSTASLLSRHPQISKLLQVVPTVAKPFATTSTTTTVTTSTFVTTTVTTSTVTAMSSLTTVYLATANTDTSSSRVKTEPQPMDDIEIDYERAYEDWIESETSIQDSPSPPPDGDDSYCPSDSLAADLSDSNEEDMVYDERRKHIVYQSSLVELFQRVRCSQCNGRLHSPTVSESKGTLVRLLSSCSCSPGNVVEWRSQPSVGRKAKGNIEIAAAIHLSGQKYLSIAKVMEKADIQFMSHTTYYDYKHTQNDIDEPPAVEAVQTG